MALAVKRKTPGNLTVKRNSILAEGNYDFHITNAEFKEVADKKNKNHFFAAMTVETETHTGLGYNEKFYIGEKNAEDDNNGEFTVFPYRFEEAAIFVERVLALEDPLEELTRDIVERLKGHDFNADIEHRDGATGAYPRIIYDSVEVIDNEDNEDNENEEE